MNIRQVVKFGDIKTFERGDYSIAYHVGYANPYRIRRAGRRSMAIGVCHTDEGAADLLALLNEVAEWRSQVVEVATE